jgi:hypothetical protein
MTLRFWNRSFAALVLLALASRADASLLPTSATTFANNNGTVAFTYGVVLTSDSTLKTGDFFTVYDFQGFVPNSNTQPAGWSFSTSIGGGTPSGITFPNSPNLPNLTWTYTGAATLTGQLGLGNFSVLSTNQQSQTSTAFAGISQRAVDGQNDSNITSTLVPGNTPAPSGVPEPATLALIGIGLPFAGLARYVRRRLS